MPQKDDLLKYIGGKGLAAKILYDKLYSGAGARPGKVEAFSQENPIVITTSPLNGSAAPSSSRFNISTISPLTGLLVSSSCGGDFGLHLKRAGYDALLITGKSPAKVFLRVNASGVEICDAGDIWGLSTSEAQQAMGKNGTLAIGVAGENLVRYASVASQERMAGRGGIGAVFGYKGLKGIVAEGNAAITMPDSDEFRSFNKKWIGKLRKHVLTGQQLPELGTAALLRKMQDRGLLATANYSAGRFDKYDSISGETLREKHLIKNKGCLTCPIQCGRLVSHEGKAIKGPELETLGLLGANIMNDDLSLIIKLNRLCDEYGLDTMSFGGSVAFAMELCAKGLWDNGLKFGQREGLEDLLSAVAHREGIGGDIAEGVRLLSEKYGGKDFAIHAKGMELAAYEPRAAQGMGLGYATANRGGCHLNGGYMVVLEGLGMRVSGRTTRGKAGLTVFFQDLMEAVSAAGSCLFTTYAVFPSAVVRNPNSVLARIVYALMPLLGSPAAFIHNHAKLLGVNARSVVPHPYAYMLVTGSDMSIGRFVKAGERIYNLERLINNLQGLTGGDTLPSRLTSEPQSEGDAKSRVRLDRMLKKYYRVRGWDSTGAPGRKRLARLGVLEKSK
ncbi:MAG: aldehyde ferredoxin oxidoreductase family protein [Oscillospiraceae bacterium]|nr:aldehyde ferredoxin oxidoreductase family protein [Oscillospiraceae bacterium]